MEIINKTKFQFALIVGQVDYPKHSITLIIKETSDLKPGQTATISDEQLFPTGDEFYPEDEDMIGGPRYASDFAYFKPRADLLLAGKCHSPQGKKVYSANVKFQVGQKLKTLTVYGNRYWVGGLSNNISTNPEPFSELELRYENSYGGEGFKKNPVGKGIKKIEIKTGDNLVPLPNILHLGEKIQSKSTKLEPAGFGPLGQMWIQRYSKIGTYKGNYLKERWPWFAKNFDWGYFNAAPADMQVNGYLRGDEKLFFENLHPVDSQYHSQLPGIKVRCFINEADEKETNYIAPKLFKEVKMNLDTLWADMENEKLVLVWRGVSDIKTEDYEEIKNIFIVSEKLEEQPHSLEYFRKQLERELAEPEEEISEPEPVDEIDEEDVEIEAEIAKAEDQMRASLIEAGIDPDNPPPQSEEDKKKEAELLKEMGFEEEVEKIPLTRELFIERAGKKESFEEEDLRGIDLSGLDLKDLNFQNAIISGVNLKNSNLSNSDLSGADLSGADLSGTKLNNTIFNDTDLTGANLKNADLTGTALDGTVFENSNIQNAILNNVKGKNPVFTGADLTGSSLIQSEFQGADFSKSILNNSNFQNSLLSETSFENAVGDQTNFTGAELNKLKASGSEFTKAIFQKAAGLETTWTKSKLKESDFSYSEFEAANFTSASLEKANLFAANMKFARFMKADLSGAALQKMNLFQGSLEKADLTRADCSGSNFYGVEFLDSIIKDTNFRLANLKMTKLSK